MIDDRDLIRHLEDGGSELYDRPEPPELDLQAITGTRPTRNGTRTWNLRPAFAVAGALALLGIGLVTGATLFGTKQGDGVEIQASSPRPTAPPSTPLRGRQVELARYSEAVPPDAAAEVHVFTATDGRTVDLKVRGLQVPRKGEFYELWVLGKAGKMISLGIIRVGSDGAAQARLPLPVSLRRFPIFDISLEPGDGDPSHSGQSVLRSAATA